MKQMKKRAPTSKMTLRYDKLMIDKDVYTYNEVAGVVELQTSTVEEGRVSPTSQPNTPHHTRVRARSKSSGRKKKLEKSFSTGNTLTWYFIHKETHKYLESALNYIGDEEMTRSPSPTKSPFPEISELSDNIQAENNQQDQDVNNVENSPQVSENGTSVVNG